MTISDEAVEAAARVLGDCEGTGSNNWEWQADNARAVLEAAAPFIRAQALEDAADTIDGGGTISKWLRARAAAERGQG